MVKGMHRTVLFLRQRGVSTTTVRRWWGSEKASWRSRRLNWEVKRGQEWARGLGYEQEWQSGGGGQALPEEGVAPQPWGLKQLGVLAGNVTGSAFMEIEHKAWREQWNGEVREGTGQNDTNEVACISLMKMGGPGPARLARPTPLHAPLVYSVHKTDLLSVPRTWQASSHPTAFRLTIPFYYLSLLLTHLTD